MLLNWIQFHSVCEFSHSDSKLIWKRWKFSSALSLFYTPAAKCGCFQVPCVSLCAVAEPAYSPRHSFIRLMWSRKDFRYPGDSSRFESWIFETDFVADSRLHRPYRERDSKLFQFHPLFQDHLDARGCDGVLQGLQGGRFEVYHHVRTRLCDVPIF